jgi:hypothetical protein
MKNGCRKNSVPRNWIRHLSFTAFRSRRTASKAPKASVSGRTTQNRFASSRATRSESRTAWRIASIIVVSAPTTMLSRVCSIMKEKFSMTRNKTESGRWKRPALYRSFSK